MDFIKNLWEKHIFNIFSQIQSFLEETTKEKVTQNGIWDILEQEKISGLTGISAYDAKMTSFGQFQKI